MLRLFKRSPVTSASGANARSAPRTLTSIPATLDFGGARFECTIVDIATGGARVEFPSSHSAIRPCFGQQLLVTPLNAPPIAAILRWAEGSYWGLRFLAPLAGDPISAITPVTGPVLRTRPSRAKIGMLAEVHIGARQHKLLLMNLSAGGAMLKGAPPVAIDDPLFLHFTGIRPTAAYVRWIDGDFVGVMFNRLLPVDDARHVAERCAIEPQWLAEIVDQHAASGGQR